MTSLRTLWQRSNQRGEWAFPCKTWKLCLPEGMSWLTNWYSTGMFRLAENPVVKIMLLVGNTMPKVFRGETTMLEHFRTSGLLDEYYAKGFGTAQSTLWLSNIVKQITDRRPHLNLLEIGKKTT